MDALHGLTVLDLTTHIAGPYATKLLADLGARVIKVEPPGGDPARALPPFLHDQPGPERSALFQFLNTSKESVVLDLSAAAGQAELGRLLPLADLVVTSCPPAEADRLGIDPDALRSRTDRPVLAITDFGRAGPYRDYALSDTVLYAMGGEMYSHGLAGRAPLKLGGTAASLQCGAMGGVAALGALLAWEQFGVSQTVELSLFETQINSVDRRSSAILAYRFSGRVQPRPPSPSAGLVGGVYPAADGYLEVTAALSNYWQRFVEMVGDDTLRDPRFLDPAAALDPALKEVADAVVYPWFLGRTRADVWEAARAGYARASSRRCRGGRASAAGQAPDGRSRSRGRVRAAPGR
jgi:crotonobetainyl-CoA:carnitine CoA-transferase CaiB-like acyl-CoA transferase